jgi:anti-anti-sigma factor
MMLQKQNLEKTTLLTLNLGKATREQANTFRSSIGEFLASGDQNFVIDCRALVWMDYSFLAALVTTLRDCASRGGDIRLVRSKYSPVWSLFELNSIAKTFKLYNDVDEAIESYSQGVRS